MRKIYLLAVLFGMMLAAQAQTFVPSPGTSVTATVDPRGSQDIYIHFNNVSQQAVTLGWETVSESYPSQWFMTICDNGSCYTLPHASDQMVPMAQGDSAFLKITCTPMETPGIGVLTYRVFDINNQSSSVEVTFNINVEGTAVTASQLSEVATVGPNPASETLHLSARNGLLDKGEVALYDLRGARVLAQPVSAVASTDLNVAALAPGMYLLRYATAAGIMTERVMVAR